MQTQEQCRGPVRQVHLRHIAPVLVVLLWFGLLKPSHGQGNSGNQASNSQKSAAPQREPVWQAIDAVKRTGCGYLDLVREGAPG